MGEMPPIGAGSFAHSNGAVARPFWELQAGNIPIHTSPPLKAVALSLSGHRLRKAGAVSCCSQEATQQGAVSSSAALGSAWEMQGEVMGAGGEERGPSSTEHRVPRGRRKKRAVKTEEELKKEVSVIMIQLYTLEEEGDRKLHHVFRKYARVFGSDAVMGALWEIIRRQNVDQALEAFEAVRSSHWYIPDPQIYAGLIRLLARHKRIRDAEDLFFAMPEHQCPPSTQACTALLEAYASRGDVRAARKLLEEMKRDSGTFPDSAAYSAVMRGYCRRGAMAEAEALLHEMHATGVEADIVAYNAVIDGYARLGHVTKLKEIYARLVASNQDPDLFTFNALLRGFARGGQTSEMEALFVSMQAQHNVAPNNQSYHCLVEGYAIWGHFDKLLRTLHYMLLLRYRPGAATWNTAIGSLSAAGRIREMERVYALMKQQRAQTTPLTFLHLICGYESAATASRSSETAEAPFQTSAPAREDAEPEPPAGVYGGAHEAAVGAARVPEPGGHGAEAGGQEAAALAERVSKLEGLSAQTPAPVFSSSGAAGLGPAASRQTGEAPGVVPGSPKQGIPRSSAHIASGAGKAELPSEAGEGTLNAEAIKRKIGAVLSQFEAHCSDRDLRVYRAALSAFTALGASKETSELVARIQERSSPE